MKAALLLLSFWASFVLHANVSTCTNCGQTYRRPNHLANSFFCSKKCAQADFICKGCKRYSGGRYTVTMGPSGESRRYCSSCSSKPKCFSCFHPAISPKTLPDRRIQCSECSSQALTPGAMQKIFSQLRQELAKKHGFDTRHRIVLRQVNKATLIKVAKNTNAMGCMKVDVTKKKQSQGKGKRKKVRKTTLQCTVYIMDNLPPVLASKVLVHELTHDYIFHHAGNGRNSMITEGICEAVSGDWLEAKNHKSYLESMKRNPDPVYGAGFREIYPQLKRYGLKGTIERYRSMFSSF